MLNKLFSQANRALYSPSLENKQRTHWINTIESVKFQGHLIELAAILEGEDEVVIL